MNIKVDETDTNELQKVDFYIDNVYKFTNNSAPYSYNWSVPSKPKVSYVIKAIAYDVAGNSASSSVTVASR